jgi:acid phosphatase (class A)
MKTVSLGAMLALTAVLGSVGYAQPAAPAGYIAIGEFDVMAVIEPAPRPGDPRYEADRAIFRETRGLAGSECYQMATNDVQTSAPSMLRDFSCAVGMVLTPESAPRLAEVAQRAALDTGAQVRRAKEIYRRERPYVIDEGPTCQTPAELFDAREQRASYDYPSGHATWGWTWALVVAGAAPDRAQQVLERGRAYSESRLVCGVHNQSAVEAGMLAASATMVVVQSKPAYQADLAAARTELETLRRSAVEPPPGCDIEARLVAEPVLPPIAARPEAR